MFLSTNWLPITWGWLDVLTGSVRILVGTDAEKFIQRYSAYEGNGIFYDKIVYHIGSFVEHGESYEEFHIFTYFPSDRILYDDIMAEKAFLCDYGIRGEPKPCYIGRNTCIIKSSNVVMIDASLTAGGFQAANQAKLDKIVQDSKNYEPIYLEGGKNSFYY